MLHCTGLVNPISQYVPKGHLPLQFEPDRPELEPNVPLGHCKGAAAFGGQYVPGGHIVCVPEREPE